MNKSLFWKRVKSTLKKRGYTLKQTAAICRVPQGTFYGWITKNILPPVDICVVLARFLNASVEYLATGKKTDTADRIEKISALLKKAETDLMELRAYIK
jgi:transcriptional regulator with XRE-family HTH domain